MKKNFANVVLFAGVLISLLLVPGAAIGAEAFKGNCEGTPAYTPGLDVGVFITCSADKSSWTIRWSGDTNRDTNFADRTYIVTGDIRTQQIANVVQVFYEADQDFSKRVTGTSGDILSFNAHVGPHEDGLDFTVSGSKVVFSLDGNLVRGTGSYTLTASDIFIGADGEHPDNTIFLMNIPQP
ncbi:MAG TPA: hypothetical protein DCO77_11530 [Nitrospiraceae bacterium]|nr:hypothetical protein [Nitrospiraceae bacterium]